MGISRRDFFRRGLAEALRNAARAAAESLPAATPAPAPSPGLPTAGRRGPTPILRPPGARIESEFLTVCTRCDDCRVACPTQSIRPAGPEHGPEAAGTPTISPEDQPCWLCADLPCIAACEPRALLPLDKPADARLGVLRVLPERCISLRGSHCDVCVDRCPVDPAPIAVKIGETPVIDRERCTGCGVCEYLCPARALEVLPVADISTMQDPVLDEPPPADAD